MDRNIHQDLKYDNLSFRDKAPEPGDYENCIFTGCDFTEAFLSDMNFIECVFSGCNLSLTKLLNTSFKDCRFTNSKLMGLHFEDCNRLLISFHFENCYVDLCSFDGLKLRKTIFRNSKITEADFKDTDLKDSAFINCDLQRSLFLNTNLEGCDFRTSFNFSIDPNLNRIKKARFSLNGLKGLLDKYDIDVEE